LAGLALAACGAAVDPPTVPASTEGWAAGPDYPRWFVHYPQGDHIIAAMPMIDGLKEINALIQRLVKERQQVSIHTVQEGAVARRTPASCVTRYRDLDLTFRPAGTEGFAAWRGRR
jgi:hypothetical protein